MTCNSVTPSNNFTSYASSPNIHIIILQLQFNSCVKCIGGYRYNIVIYYKLYDDFRENKIRQNKKRRRKRD